LATHPLWGLAEIAKSGPANWEIPLSADWAFLGRASAPSEPVSISLPHSVANLSWQDWNPELWEDVFLYRKTFPRPHESTGRRTFLMFEGAMVTADVTVNGSGLPQHRGGYLPFRYELTSVLQEENTVDVKLDARFQDVPPEGSPRGRSSIDYYVPGGMIRGAKLCTVPQVYIADVFAKPADVLAASRRVDFTCTVDAGVSTTGAATLRAELLDGDRVIARARKDTGELKSGSTEITFSMSGLEHVTLWKNDHPQLYNIVVTLHIAGKPVHDYRTRIGFRETKFADDGFYLNGKKMQFFGLDRHELFPYTGYAMPARVMRKDAEIIRHEFNCNIVRCSHYPQHEAFLDACDELGLMVWEETPGWQYIGDQAFQDQVVDDVRDMIRRDRNHPSIIVWGVRVNESHNDPPLYDRTYAAAKELDDSRPTSGSMTGFSNWKTDWHEDVFAYDDYHQSPGGTVQILPPLAGIPYMLAETVGQRTYTASGFNNKYRRAADVTMQYHQAIYHAQAHDRARAYDRMCGVIAWCAFEYASPQNSYKGIKNPGVADVFRIPKLGAAFYQSQVNPSVRAVIAPNFYWDFGPMTPRGPGKNLALFHNCDRVELFVDGQHHATAEPDRQGYPHLLYPLSWVDLEFDGRDHPELRIDGFVNGRKVVSRAFSSDPSLDQLLVTADDRSIRADGIDATRVIFQVVDKYGAPRLLGSGNLTIDLTGPGELIGDRTFSLTESGGAGAVWVRSTPNARGVIAISITHPSLGTKKVHVVAAGA
jgi:beta-galactosidase